MLTPKIIESKINLLLVDDRPENLLALEAVLEPLGVNLLQARSGTGRVVRRAHTRCPAGALRVLERRGHRPGHRARIPG